MPDSSADKVVCFNYGVGSPCVISELIRAPTYHLCGGPLVFSGQNFEEISVRRARAGAPHG